MKIATAQRRKNRKKLLYGLAVLVAAVLILSALELTGTTHLFHKQAVARHTASEYTKGEPLNNTNSSSNNNSGNDKNSVSQPTSDNTMELLEPTGNFVSNHNASLSSSGMESSTCNTTPGAKCVIRFTKNGIVKSLESKTTDQGGAAYWSWSVGDVGLSEGTWTVQAVASLGSQSSTTNDALTLTVRP